MEFSTHYNLGTVRDRHINPYIFINNIKRRIQIRVNTNLKIQISNGQIFKFLTVKNSNCVNTGEQSSKHVYNIPKPLGHHIWSILSLNRAKIWCGEPWTAVYLLSHLQILISFGPCQRIGNDEVPPVVFSLHVRGRSTDICYVFVNLVSTRTRLQIHRSFSVVKMDPYIRSGKCIMTIGNPCN